MAGTQMVYGDLRMGRGQLCRGLAVIGRAPMVNVSVATLCPLQGDEGTTLFVERDEATIQVATFFLHDTYYHLHASLAQHADATSLHPSKGILAADDHARDAHADDEFCTRRCLSIMSARLKADIERTAFQQSAVGIGDTANGIHLRMRSSTAHMVAFADDTSIGHDDGPHHWVGWSTSLSLSRQLYAATHVYILVLHKKSYFCPINDNSMMKLFRDIVRRLSTRYDTGEARAVAFLLLEEAFAITRTDVYADKVRNFSPQEHALLDNILQRLVDGEPIQYILGHARFFDQDFLVTPATLIPRPETEELVRLVACHLEDISSEAGSEKAVTPGILDVGTGTGCIAITLKHLFPHGQVEAWDISDEALGVARKNAQRLGAEICFRQVDALCPDKHPSLSSPMFLVSNPPYVLQREAVSMEQHVLDHEPHTALFVPDEDPLLFYRALLRIATEDGFDKVFLETNRAYAEDVATLFRHGGYAHSIAVTDQYGAPRFVIAQD